MFSALLKHLYIATVQLVEFSGFEFLNDLMLVKRTEKAVFASSYITDHSGDQVLLQNFLQWLSTHAVLCLVDKTVFQTFELV